jgi:hypothetical protein
MSNKNRAALCIFILTALSLTIVGQEREPVGKRASLVISISEKGEGYVMLSVMPEPPPGTQLDLVLSGALGVSFSNLEVYTKETIKARMETFKAEMARDPEAAAELAEESQNLEEEMADEDFDYGYSLTAMFTTGQSGLNFEKRIDLLPLLEVIRRSGNEWLDVTITHPGTEGEHCVETRWNNSATEYKVGFHTLRASAADPATAIISLDYGFDFSKDYLSLIVPIAVVLLVPIALTLWMRRRVLKLYTQDPAAAFYRFFRSQNYILNGAWLA